MPSPVGDHAADSHRVPGQPHACASRAPPCDEGAGAAGQQPVLRQVGTTDRAAPDARQQTMRVRIARDEPRRLRELTQAITALETDIAVLVPQVTPQLLAQQWRRRLVTNACMLCIVENAVYGSIPASTSICASPNVWPSDTPPV